MIGQKHIAEGMHAAQDQSDRLRDMDMDMFHDWVRLLEDRTGVLVPDERKSFLLAGLRRRMREIGLEDFRAYFDYLAHDASSLPEWSILEDRLTVHETAFFRHPESIELVHQACRAKREREGARARFHAWSAGCATGQEAYTLAMVIDEWFGGADGGRQYGVAGTDISLPALKTARDAVYSERALGGIESKYRQAYCRKLGNGKFQILPELRARVCFTQVNLINTAGFPLQDVDLIYCQNVLIYFERSRRKQILEQMVNKLAPGGLLIFGPCDLPTWAHPEMEKIKAANTMAFAKQGGG